jgi:hypothetical protein
VKMRGFRRASKTRGLTPQAEADPPELQARCRRSPRPQAAAFSPIGSRIKWIIPKS